MFDAFSFAAQASPRRRQPSPSKRMIKQTFQHKITASPLNIGAAQQSMKIFQNSQLAQMQSPLPPGAASSIVGYDSEPKPAMTPSREPGSVPIHMS